MPQTSAQLKGSLFPLSVLQLEDNNLDKLQSQLANKLSEAPAFFFRAPVVVNVEGLANHQLDFGLLKSTIEQSDFICVGVCNASTEQKKQARLAGLATMQQPKASAAPKVSPVKAAPTEPVPTPTPAVTSHQPAKIVRQNVRSGQQIYAKDCDLVIIGSVSNGAEVISDGSIHIYGTLRGRAIAGASGNTDSAIFCQSLQAELVSIAGTYWLSESLQQTHWQQAGFIKLHQEQLVVDELPSMNN